MLYYEPSIEESEILSPNAPDIWGEKILPETIHRIVRDDSGELWFLPSESNSVASAVAPRLYRLSVHTDYEHASVPIVSSLPGYRPEALAVNDLARLSNDEKIFLLATEDGLLTAHLDGSRLVIDSRMTEAEGLVSKRVWAVAEGLDGDAWICYPSSGRGVTRVRFSPSRVIESFDVDDGLAAPEVWSMLRFGQSMFFATDAGISRFDGDLWYSFPVESRDSQSSRVLPMHVRRQGDDSGSLLLGTSDSWVMRFHSDDKRRPRIQKLSFPLEVEEGKDAVFEWVARDYKNWTRPDDLIYRYRVDGGEWTHAKRIAAISLPAAELTLGKHTLELEVRDLDGNRNRDFADRIHDFFVRPRSAVWPPLLTFVALGASGLIVAWFLWVRRRRQQRRFARYRSVYFGFPGAVLLVDKQGRVLEYNGRYPRLLGLEPHQKEEIARRPLRLVPGLVSLGLDSQVEQALAGRQFSLRGQNVLLPDGRQLSIDVSGFPMTKRALDVLGGDVARDSDRSSVSGVVIVVEDRTREWQKDALRSRDFRLRGIRDFADRLSEDLPRSPP